MSAAGLAEAPTPDATLRAAGGWTATVGAVRVVFGAGRLAELGEEARRLGAARVLLVSDPGVVAAGHAAAAAGALAASGLAVTLFSGVEENPTADQVAAGAAFAAGRGVDLIAAVGGGSALDAAKGINFLLTQGSGRMADFEGHGRAKRPMLPSIGVPTTAGTGSEAQSYALISDPASHRKMACGDDKARFRTVILDPALTASAPRRVAAAAGLDAVAHAVESYVTRTANPASRMLAREAWRLLEGSFEGALGVAGGGAEEEELGREKKAGEARAAVLLGAHLAGAAIEQSMLGAAHACANPLTARFGTVHGVAVALMLPAVVRWNGAVAGALYADLAAVAGLAGAGAEAVARRVEALRAVAGLPGRLAEIGVGPEAFAELAAQAATQWTGRHNPRPTAEDDFTRLYEAAA